MGEQLQAAQSQADHPDQTAAATIGSLHSRSPTARHGSAAPPAHDTCAFLSTYHASHPAAAPECMKDLAAGAAAQCLHKDGALPGRHTDVAMLVTGAAYAEEATAAVNSLLYFRSCPVHVFVVADRAGRDALTRRSPWNGADDHAGFTWSLIDQPADPADVTDGVTSSYRGRALLKAAMDRLLPATVDRVVVTDVDVLWTGDVCDVHADMDAWPAAAFVGLAPEDAYYYAEPGRAGTGFPIPDDHPHKLHRMDGVNSGVVAYKLAAARRAGFTAAWAAHVQRVADPLVMGDQDAFNRYLTAHPQRLHILPPAWNHQLHYGGNSGAPVWRGVRVLHNNGPTKLADPIFRQWWPAFSSGVVAYKNQTWGRLTGAGRCCLRAALRCLVAHGGVCAFGEWQGEATGAPFYAGRGYHTFRAAAS